MATAVKETDPEKMSLEELKAAAMAEEEKEPEVKAAPDPEIIDNSADVTDEPEPEEFIYRKAIDLEDGSGVQVFTGRGATKDEAFEDFAEKMAEAQRNATVKIRELTKQRKAEETRTAQATADDDYVLSERLKKEPRKVIAEEVAKEIASRESAQQRSLAAQQTFVDTHPDYVTDRDNGQRLTAEVQRLGYAEFTEESLEKAYQSLKSSGLLKLKVEEAGGTTEVEAKEAERIAQPKVEATQPRSPKRASTVSARGGSSPVTKTILSEDELYSMPLDKLRNLANQQMSGGE